MPLLERIASGLRDARGTRRLALAAAAGASGALAFPPFYFFPLLLLGYAVLIHLLDGAAAQARPSRDAALIGWSYGFGFHLIGLHWIGYAFLVDSERHAWLLPFVTVLMPGGLALFFAAAAAVSVRLWRPGAQRIFVFTLAFASAEWLRGHILTGFPWNLPGYGWGGSFAMLQSTALFGIYGLSLLTLLFGASLALFAARPRALWLPLTMTAFFAALFAHGALRLAGAGEDNVAGVQLRLVQPATPQSEKYAPQLVARNWQRLVDLTTMPADEAPTHIIWPEAAPPFPLLREPQALAEIAELTGESRVLLTGAVRIGAEAGAPRYYNSFYLFGARGAPLAAYDKFHLVPFGEYMPFAPVLYALGVREIAAATGFSAGSGPVTLPAPGAPPFTPLICYEIIFPGAVTGFPRPSWLVNITDDSWFGPNAGPMQHLLIARVRAIEEGLPVARAANAGISAIIDPYGRLRGRLDLGVRGVLDGPLPAALAATQAARFGGIIFMSLLVLTAGLAFAPGPARRA